MKSKMKSAFAIIAVALMIMVAIVPMAGMLVSDTDTSADDTGNVTVVVKQNNGSVLAGVKVTTTLSDDVTGADGKVTIPIASAANLTLKPEKFGFKFCPESVQLNTDVKAGDTFTFTAFTNQSIVSLTAGGKAVSSATVEVITKTAYDALDAAATGFGTATTYTADAEGKVYISMVEPTMYLRVISASPATDFNGALTFSGETGAKANAYTVAGAKTVVADQTLYTVNVADKSNTEITETINVSITDDQSTTPVPATTLNGKALILFKKAATATKVIATATNYSGAQSYTFTVDTTGVAKKDVSGNAVTFNALESQYTLKVADKDNKISMSNGTVTVSYTLNGETTDYSHSATATFDNTINKFKFTVLDNQLKNIKVVLSGSFTDCLNNAFTFPGNEATPSAGTYVFTNTGVKDITINAKEGTISISGNVFYKDGATKYEGAGELKLGTQTIDNTVAKGSYSFYVMKVAASSNIVFDLSGAGGFTSLNTIITLPAGLEKSITGMNFTLNQSKKVSVSIAVSNGGAIDNVSGLTVKAGDVTLTWNSTTKTYDGQLERASCTVTVGPKIGSATSATIGSITIVDSVMTYDLAAAGMYAVNEDNVTITLSKINVSGYISYKSDDGKYRPIMDESTSLKYTVGAAAEATLTTKLNGEYGGIEAPYGEVVKFKYAPTAGTKYYESSVKVDSLTGVQVANIKLDAFEYKTVATGNIFGNKAFATNAKVYYISKISVTVNSSGTATPLDVDENGSFNFNTLEVKAGDRLTISSPAFRFGLSSAYPGETITVPASMKIEVNTKEYIYEGKITAANGCALEGVTTTYTDVTNGDAATSATYTTTSSDKDGKFYFIITPATSKETKLFKVTSTTTGSTAYEYSPYYRVQTVISTAEKIGEWSISTGLLTNTIDATTYDPKWDGDLRSIDYYISGTVTDAFSKHVDAGVLKYKIGTTEAAIAVTDDKFVIGKVASDATLTFPDNASYGKVTGGDNWKTTPSLKLVTEKGKLTVTVNEAKKSYDATVATGTLKTITPSAVMIDDVLSTGTHYAKMNSKVKVTLGTNYYGEVLEGTVSSSSITLASTYVTFAFGVFAVDSPFEADTGTIKVDGVPAMAADLVTKILKADAEHKVTCDWTSDGRYIIDGNGTLSNTDEKLITIQKVDISRHVFKVTYKDASGRYGIPDADMNVYAKAEVTSSNYVGTFVTDENGEFFIDADKYAKVTVGADKGIWLFTPFGDLYSIEYVKKADLAAWPANYAIDVKAAEVRAEFDFTGYYDHKAVSGLEVTFKYDDGREILKTTDSEGKIYLDAVKENTAFTISSPAHVFVSTDAQLKTEVRYTVTETAYGAEYLAGKYTIGGNIAYDGGKDGRVVASNDSFVVGDEKVTTDKDGKFTLTKVSTTYVFSKIGFTDVSVDDYALINVDGVITYDLGTVVFEYKPVEGQLFVKNKVAFTGAGLNDLAVIKDAKSDAKGVVSATEAVDISFVTDDEGMYSFDVPNAVTTVEGITDNGYPFSIDVATGAVTVSADRVLVNVSDSATKDLKDVVVLGSRSESKFFEYRAVTDKDGTAIFDAVDAANFYAYIPGFTVSYAFGSDGSTIAAGANGTYKVAGYAMQFGGEPVANVTTYKIFLNGVQVSTAIEGDAVVISMENGDAGATLKVITTSDGTYVSSLNSTSFKYWELSDGTTSDKAQIAFVAGSDSMKTVGDSNAYAFTAVFDESCDKVISSDSSSEQKINPTVLVIGIAAVIIALIAVVYTVIQKKE